MPQLPACTLPACMLALMWHTSGLAGVLTSSGCLDLSVSSKFGWQVVDSERQPGIQAAPCNGRPCRAALPSPRKYLILHAPIIIANSMKATLHCFTRERILLALSCTGTHHAAKRIRSPDPSARSLEFSLVSLHRGASSHFPNGYASCQATCRLKNRAPSPMRPAPSRLGQLWSCTPQPIPPYLQPRLSR